MQKKNAPADDARPIDPMQAIYVDRAVELLKLDIDGEPANMRAVVARLVDEFQIPKDLAILEAQYARQRLKGSHGGARAGAGRPALSPHPTIRRTVTLPSDLIERLVALGDGNLSAGIRRLAQRAGM